VACLDAWERASPAERWTEPFTEREAIGSDRIGHALTLVEAAAVLETIEGRAPAAFSRIRTGIERLDTLWRESRFASTHSESSYDTEELLDLAIRLLDRVRSDAVDPGDRAALQQLATRPRPTATILERIAETEAWSTRRFLISTTPFGDAPWWSPILPRGGDDRRAAFVRLDEVVAEALADIRARRPLAATCTGYETTPSHRDRRWSSMINPRGEELARVAILNFCLALIDAEGIESLHAGHRTTAWQTLRHLGVIH
jgi:hypothetical protein